MMIIDDQACSTAIKQRVCAGLKELKIFRRKNFALAT
jgi:hypothetical protein